MNEKTLFDKIWADHSEPNLGNRIWVDDVFPAEKDLCLNWTPRPGMLVATSDPDWGGYGALGMLVLRLDPGETYGLFPQVPFGISKPLQMRARLEGQLHFGIEMPQVIEFVKEKTSHLKFENTVLELSGELVTNCTVEERMELCRGVLNLGFRGCIMGVDTKVVQMLETTETTYAESASPFEGHSEELLQPENYQGWKTDEGASFPVDLSYSSEDICQPGTINFRYFQSEETSDAFPASSRSHRDKARRAYQRAWSAWERSWSPSAAYSLFERI